MARKFDSEIKIDSTGKWFFKGNEIIQENVLSHFKNNLIEDEIGIYIENQYAELIEHGYIQAEYFPLKINNYKILNNLITLIIETGKTISIYNFDFFMDSEERLFCMIKNSKYLRFNFSHEVLQFLGNYLEKENDTFFLKINDESIIIQNFNDSINITIPNF